MKIQRTFPKTPGPVRDDTLTSRGAQSDSAMPLPIIVTTHRWGRDGTDAFLVGFRVTTVGEGRDLKEESSA